MSTSLIRKMAPELSEYLRDESRNVGSAESISFPRREAEIIEILRQMNDEGTPVTIQGARTGLSAAAVPNGGHIMNVSRMDKLLRLREENGTFYLTVEPGVVLLNLRKMLSSRRLEVENWSQESLETLERLKAAPEHFFPTDPTETTATIGGMTACNASGARSYMYGAMRKHVTAVRGVLADGRTFTLKRGQVFATGLEFSLPLDDGSVISGTLPEYKMPKVKNASGYYVAPDMDMLDLFVGSDGTLAVLTEIELELLKLPPVIWGVTCFFPHDDHATLFTELVREHSSGVAAIEYFDGTALDILTQQRAMGGVFARLPAVKSQHRAAIYTELHCETTAEATEKLRLLYRLMVDSGSNPEDSWVARTDADLETLSFFRHAVPESVNSLIDERRKTYPNIAKQAGDMSVLNRQLPVLMEIYRLTLAEVGLQFAAWGHIGDNHLHVNILPKNMEEFAKGKAMLAQWADVVSRLGGAVSAEHGVGKIKAPFLVTMVGKKVVDQMRQLKRTFDPKGILGQGNMFSTEVEK